MPIPTTQLFPNVIPCLIILPLPTKLPNPIFASPFTIAPVIFLIIMKEKFDSLNPLHWWPMFWGYNAKLPDEDRITIRPTDVERIMRQHGGRLNVHIMDYERIKFRRKKDAVIFGLKYF